MNRYAIQHCQNLQNGSLIRMLWMKWVHTNKMSQKLNIVYIITELSLSRLYI